MGSGEGEYGAQAALALELPSREGAAGAAAIVRAQGEWTFRGLVASRRQLAQTLADIERRPADSLRWDLTGVTELDDARAVWLARALQQAQNIEIGPRHQEMLHQASQ